jgi:uncharacterized protein YuzE
MRVTYDPDADAAYIYLVPAIKPGESHETVTVAKDDANQELERDLMLDFDREGRLLGIEVLAARGFLRDELLDSAPPPGKETS